MSKRNFRLVLVAVLGSLLAMVASAQTTGVKSSVADKYLISAEAGGVNYANGGVSVLRANGTSGILLKGDQIKVGDKISTGENGRIEVLLNPGSYLRAGSNAEFEFKTTSLDDLRIRVDRGSALFEVFASKDFVVTVLTPNDQVQLVESGVYRVDIGPNGNGTVAVTKGKAKIEDDGELKSIKKGKTGTLGTDDVIVAKFDRDERDELAEWSRSRAKDLAKMTSSLRNDSMRDSLLTAFDYGRWGFNDSFGLWVRDWRTGFYCFLPFGYGWSSPYGYGFGQGIYWFNLPRRVYYPPIQTTGRTPSGYGNAGQTPKNPPTRRTRQEPPYRSLEPRRQAPIDGWGNGSPSGMGRGTSNTPIFAPPSRSSSPSMSPGRSSGGDIAPPSRKGIDLPRR